MRILFKAFLLIVKNSCFLQVLWLNTQHEKWNKLWNFYIRKIDFWFFFQRKGETFHCSILLPQHLQTTRGFWFEKALSLWQEFSPSLKSGATRRRWKHSSQIRKHFQQRQATAPPSLQCGIGGRDFSPLNVIITDFGLIPTWNSSTWQWFLPPLCHLLAGDVSRPPGLVMPRRNQDTAILQPGSPGPMGDEQDRRGSVESGPHQKAYPGTLPARTVPTRFSKSPVVSKGPAKSLAPQMPPDWRGKGGTLFSEWFLPWAWR